MAEPTYRQRLNALNKPVTYRLSDNALLWEFDEGGTGALSFDRIKEVRASYRPTRVQTNLYRTRIVARDGRRLDITNSSFVGFAEFEDHSEDYATFIRELHGRLAASGAKITFRKGSSIVGYIGNLAITLGAFVLLATVVLTIGFADLSVSNEIRLGIIVFFLPVLVVFMKRSRPALYSPQNIPEDALPPPQREETAHG